MAICIIEDAISLLILEGEMFKRGRIELKQFRKLRSSQ